MIIEQRIYTLRPGALNGFLDLYRREGLQIHVRHLGALLGYYVTDIGPLNTVMHLWGYAGVADRDRRRAELYADSDWLAFAAKSAPLFPANESRLLKPASFFELKQNRY